VIEALPNLPAGVIGFEAVGDVTAADYETVLRPALDAAAAAGDIRLVYVLGGRFEGYSSGATWEDAKLIGAGHLSAWRRTALVSDHGSMSTLATMFGWLVPGKFRHFSVADLDKAITWAAAD
jgi:hypothetical protein